MVNWWFGARWFGFLGSPYERDSYLKVPFESQTTNRNQQLTIDLWKLTWPWKITRWIIGDTSSFMVGLPPVISGGGPSKLAFCAASTSMGPIAMCTCNATQLRQFRLRVTNFELMNSHNSDVSKLQPLPTRPTKWIQIKTISNHNKSLPIPPTHETRRNKTDNKPSHQPPVTNRN